jgi:ankyrin repeat protein
MDGNVLAVRAVLKTGVSLSSFDNKGRTALMYAVAKGNLPTIEEVVGAGADPTAVDHSGKRVDQFALTRSNFDAISPVITAARFDWKAAHPSIHDDLFPETYSFQSLPGSPAQSQTSPHTHPHPQESSQLVRDDSFFGSPSRALTASPFSPGTRKRHPPKFASPFNPKANRSTLELVRIADYVALDAFLDGCSLVAINEVDKKAGRTALMVAVLQQKMIPLMMLLEAGADDLEIKDSQGKTALAHAAATGNLKFIQPLLDAGANVHPLDGNGRTPLDQAELGQNEEVWNLLSAASSPKRKTNRSLAEESKYEESKLDDGGEEKDEEKEEEESKCEAARDESKEELNGILSVDCD